MQIEYDGRTDTLIVTLRRGIATTRDRRTPGTTLAFDAAGNLLAIEITEASRRVDEPRSMSLTTRD